jgi:hypothetical protein
MSDSNSQNTPNQNPSPGTVGVMPTAEALAAAAAAMGTDTHSQQATASQDPVADAQAELANVKAQNATLADQYLRAQADVQNAQFAPKVLVSIASTPTAKYLSCTPRTISGRETLRISLQPSWPWKSLSVGSASCNIVPIAPSAITVRDARAWRSNPAGLWRLGLVTWQRLP